MISSVCSQDGVAACQASPQGAQEQGGDARNPFLGSLGSRRHWEGEVDGGGNFRRNNDGEGCQEQGEGGETGL
jgi:hypothetical protein